MKKCLAHHLATALGVLVLYGITGLAAASGDAENESIKLSPAEAPVGATPEPGAPHTRSQSLSRSKILFDLERLDAEGLQGPPDGLRALHYEYCIPDRADAIRQVAAIDPTLEIHRGSPGRVGCGVGELLCLGHTHQPNHREILERLAELTTITEIRECFFE